MSELTSEKIAKSLKGAGLNSKQRIEKAHEAWSNNAIFFPNKDDFLFEWICTAFAKPNLKKLYDCSLFQLPYWTLLSDLLEHYDDKINMDSNQSAPTIHVNLIASVSTVLQHVYKNCLDQPQIRLDLLSSIHRCLKVLLSDRFSVSYRPAFEHVSAGADQLLTSLAVQVDLCLASPNEPLEQKVLYELVPTALLVLKKFDAQLVLAANQKKIFTSIVDKSLVKLLCVRRRILIVDNTDQIFLQISQLISDIICHVLFHTDTILEYTSVLKELSLEVDGTPEAKVKQTNYVVRLFETLEFMVTKDAEHILDAIDMIPDLFSAFLGSYRQKRNASTAVMQDISRMAEFGFFVYLLRILNLMKEQQVSAYLRAVCQLLKKLLQLNVYSSRNDDIAKSQQNVLHGIADNTIMYLQNDQRYDQGLALDLADVLLKIDFSLIENRIQELWPILLNPVDTAQTSCFNFATSILNTYSASRQLDAFVMDLINGLGKLNSNDMYGMLKKPMFTEPFLKEFSSVVSKSMPAAQALGIFSELQTSLLVKQDSEPALKKQKKEKTKEPSKTNNVLLLARYMVAFTHALRLNRHQLSTFEPLVKSIYDDFVKPSINANQSAQNTLLPALQIHFALITAFFDIYVSKFKPSQLEWLADAYLRIFDKHRSEDTLESSMTVVATANAMLQHAYYSSLLQQTATKQTTSLVNKVIDFVIETSDNSVWYQETQWNGSMLDLTNANTVKLACWKLISDEWFDSVAKWIDSGRAEKIALIIFTSLANDNAVSEDVISAQLLNTSLLRSANFYEAKCFKECNIQAILDIFIGFAVDLSSSKSNQICQVAMDTISKMKAVQPFVVEQATIQPLLNALKSSKNMMDEDEQKGSTRYVEKMTQLMKLLLIFPIEYYEKNERTQTIYLATLIDIWSTHYSSASPLSRARLSLMARTLQLRFIDYFSIHSIMGLEPLVLDWFVSSSQGWDLEDVVLLDSLEHTTSEIDQQVLRKMIMNASSKTPDQHAYRYLQDTLKQRIADLERNDDQVTLVKLIHLLCAINSVLAHRKVSEADLTNIAYAADTMSYISQYIIASLQAGKTTVTTLSKKMSDNSDSRQQIFIDYQDAFVTIKHIFHLTRLVQEYAQIVGLAVDEVIAAEELSKTLTSLASPFIQFLQSALQPNEAGYSVVLNMTTEFIAAFCSVSTRYQQIDITKRVLAAVWFVYSLVYKTGDQASISILSKAFASWIRSLSKEQYEIVFQSFVEQAEEESSNRTDNTREERTLVYLSFFSLLMTNCADSEKSRLKKIIPAIILKLSMIAGKTTSFKYMQELLKMLLQLTGDQSYHFKDYDLSLLLSCLLQIAHPTAPKRFEGQIDAESAKKTFADVCSILINLVTHHKEQTVYMMPPFIALVQSLLHCFKSSHVSLVTGKKRKQGDDKTKIKTGRTVSLLTQFAPLDDVSAQRYARVLTTIPQKQHALPTSKSGQTLQRLVAKHTPSILIEYFSIQSNPNMSVVTPSTKSILTNALYDILDVCSEADRNYVLSCLDASGKTLFKSFYTSWKENHKYTGQ